MPSEVCQHEGCEKPRARRSWCQRHYSRWYAYGTTGEFDPIPFDPSPGVDEEVVERYRKIAGEGRLDERSRRILKHWRERRDKGL